MEKNNDNIPAYQTEGINAIIAENIRKCRVLWGIKQSVFAEELAISRRTLSSYENAHTPIPSSVLQLISRKLGFAGNVEKLCDPGFIPPRPIFYE